MTEVQLRQSVVSTITSWLGKNEGDGSFKPIIDLYNKLDPLPRGYKMKYTDPWCACTASAVAVATGLTDIMPPECSCSAMIALYKAHKDSRWEENDAYIPIPGDLIFYDWDDNGVGDNVDGPEHVGIVVAVAGNIISVMEGNMGNGVVGKRDIPINGKFIRGFAIPAYGMLADKPHTYADDVDAMVALGVIKQTDGEYWKTTNIEMVKELFASAYTMIKTNKNIGGQGDPIWAIIRLYVAGVIRYPAAWFTSYPSIERSGALLVALANAV